jgi:acetyltransferase-like isoleucine patch superfamily enzyme
MIDLCRTYWRAFKKDFKQFRSVNWLKTIYFNYKKFPPHIARKLPVYFYGKVKFTNISGYIELPKDIKKGMIGFGQRYEMNSLSSGIAELHLYGKITFSGYTQFGKDYFIYVDEDATLSFGNMASLGYRGRIICTNTIRLGDYARLGSECQIIDTNFHEIIDVTTQKAFKMSHPITIGDYNFISNRVTFLGKAQTPEHTIVASNSLVNNNLLDLGPNCMIGGVPSKKIKSNVTRNWEAEQPLFETLKVN